MTGKTKYWIYNHYRVESTHVEVYKVHVQLIQLLRSTLYSFCHPDKGINVSMTLWGYSNTLIDPTNI